MSEIVTHSVLFCPMRGKEQDRHECNLCDYFKDSYVSDKRLIIVCNWPEKMKP